MLDNEFRDGVEQLGRGMVERLMQDFFARPNGRQAPFGVGPPTKLCSLSMKLIKRWGPSMTTSTREREILGN